MSSKEGIRSVYPTPGRDGSSERPVIFDFERVAPFISAMLEWRKCGSKRFSVRGEVRRIPGLSPSLVSRVAKGERSVTPDQVEGFAKLLKLTAEEKLYLDRWVRQLRRPPVPGHSRDTDPETRKGASRRTPQNHLLDDWLNVYVRDAARLRSFRPEPEALFRLLGGIASLSHIRRSLTSLFRQGFLRKSPDGRVVKNEFLATTTDEIPNAKIRRFHKKALEIARRNLDLFPLSRRRESAMILPVDQKNLPELKALLKDFQQQLIAFAEDHPNDDEQLYQVVINLTPIGSHDDESK